MRLFARPERPAATSIPWDPNGRFRPGARLWLLAALAAAAILALFSVAWAQKAGPALPGERPPASAPARVGPRLTPEPAFGWRAKPSVPLRPDAVESRQSSVEVPALATPAPAPTPSGIPSLDLLPSVGTPAFRIGYIPRPSEDGMNETLGRRLVEFLRQDRDLRRALLAQGYSGDIALLPADGYNDLANRLEHEQFDVAFCPAAVFASLQGAYQVILMERHPGDIIDSRGDEPARRQGVIFAGPTSPLFHQTPTTATLSRLLAEQEFAVPSAYDAAGFQYPCLALADEYGISPKQLRLRFCGSSREVVEHVVSGLAEIGACDEATLERWLVETAPDVPLEKMAWVLPISMRPIPTDPVIVRESLAPRHSEAGRKIRDALPRFFQTHESAGFGLLPSRNEYYDDLRQDLLRLESVREKGARP